MLNRVVSQEAIPIPSGSMLSSMKTAIRLLSLLPLLALSAAPSANELRAFIGEARTVGGGELIYEEHHLVRYAGESPSERLVMYRCPDGQAFARKRVDYGQPLFAPTFRLDDVRFGYAEGYAAGAPRGEAFVQAGKGNGERREGIKAGAALVVDAGFDEFVRANWGELQRGDSVRLEFLVPSRLAAYRFSVRKVRSEAIFGEPASVFQLALSGVLGWFADAIDVAYRDSDQRLMRFEGLTNIRATPDSNHVARIDFPPAREGTEPDAETWSRAGDESLASCTLGG